MLDIGVSELFLIAVVGLIVIGPKDLPVVIKHAMKLWREVRGIYLGLKKQAIQLMDEAGINEIHEDVTTIIDLEGKPQKAYDVKGLEQLRGNGGASQGVSLSLRERLGEGEVRAEAAGQLHTAEQSVPSPQPSPSGRGGTPPAAREAVES